MAMLMLLGQGQRSAGRLLAGRTLLPPTLHAYEYSSLSTPSDVHSEVMELMALHCGPEALGPWHWQSSQLPYV